MVLLNQTDSNTFTRLTLKKNIQLSSASPYFTASHKNRKGLLFLEIKWNFLQVWKNLHRLGTQGKHPKKTVKGSTVTTVESLLLSAVTNIQSIRSHPEWTASASCWNEREYSAVLTVNNLIWRRKLWPMVEIRIYFHINTPVVSTLLPHWGQTQWNLWWWRCNTP